MAKNTKNTAQILHFDLYGRRDDKYSFLKEHSLASIPWTELQPDAPNFFLVKKDFEVRGAYEVGFKVDELFSLSSSGIKTHRDDFVIDFNRNDLEQRIEYFFDAKKSNEQVRQKFKLKDNRDWSMETARQNRYVSASIQPINYRPFDTRFIYYEQGLIDFGREKVMMHVLSKNNICLIICRQQSSFDFQHSFLQEIITDVNSISLQTKEISFAFPLYLYPDTTTQTTLHTTARTPNLNTAIVQQIADKIGLQFTNEKEQDPATFAPIDLLDYIYAVLHSPMYRETYKEFLKIDFPRVPYPKDVATFWALVALGSQLRQTHLLESPAVDKNITQYPEDGDNVVKKIRYEGGHVYINETQYFANVPPVAWSFYIGGYQPAQKWLKDRKDRVLDFEDVGHYRRIIAALVETDRLMRAVDEVGVV